MADYTTAAIVKARLDIINNVDDTALGTVITAASRNVDSMCNRFFSTGSTEVRYFTADCSTVIDIDDLVSVTSLTTDLDGDRVYETTWATTDYDLEPYNAVKYAFPYTKISMAPNGRYGFPTLRKSIAIDAVWGWAAIPAPISEATILMTIRWFKRKDSPYGIAGSNELGQIQMMPSSDPDIKAMLAPYRRMTIGAF